MTLRWGIVGLGKIAHKFIHDVQILNDHQVVAVASRDINRSQEFARQYGVQKSYGSYEELFQDELVDVVYIATPHVSHAELSLLAIASKKHVLCEKPMAINQKEVSKVIEAARKAKVFFMEALWSRFNPAIQEVLQLIKQGEIGEVKYINADFSFIIEQNPELRLLNLNLAGGSLLDVGIYPIFLAYSVLGKPKQIKSSAQFHETGADLQTSMIFEYSNSYANLFSGFLTKSDMVAKIYGTRGSLFIDKIWHQADGYTLLKNGQTEHRQLPKLGKGYTHEIEECMQCITANKLESDLWSHGDSLALIEIMDEVRSQIGLVYPNEN